MWWRQWYQMLMNDDTYLPWAQWTRTAFPFESSSKTSLTVVLNTFSSSSSSSSSSQWWLSWWWLRLYPTPPSPSSSTPFHRHHHHHHHHHNHTHPHHSDGDHGREGDFVQQIPHSHPHHNHLISLQSFSGHRHNKYKVKRCGLQRIFSPPYQVAAVDRLWVARKSPLPWNITLHMNCK